MKLPTATSPSSTLLPLARLGVLVTRPEAQATLLCELLEAQGAKIYRLPAFEIRPLEAASSQSATAPRAAPAPRDTAGTPLGAANAIDDLALFDLVIFTSSNAVKFGAHLLAPTSALQASHAHTLKLAALGPATARALADKGFHHSIEPQGTYDSEGLLAHPEIAQLKSAKILIIKGRGGRELLAQELQARGLQVAVAEVYQRIVATPDETTLNTVLENFATDAIQVVIANSLETVQALLKFATPALTLAFNAVHWLVPSQRVADAARKLGLQAPLSIAASASDHDLVAAIILWRS